MMNPTRRSFLATSAAVIAGSTLALAQPPMPEHLPGTRKRLPPKMSFISNDRIKLGIDLSLGGAITHLSPADVPEKNVVNSWDLGRQIQMSYYSGPVPFTVEGHAGPPPQWKHIGWNPIQVGDDYGNPGQVLEHANDGKSLYIKCRPMQWPLENVPGECTFECWITLEGSAARVRCRLNMSRADKTQWMARTQECPAVYTNGPWYRLMTYKGDKPFTDGAVERIEKEFLPDSPWAHWSATEHWAALVDDQDWGLGVWNPHCLRYSGGFAGKPGKGGPHDSPTGYISPNRQEILDHNLVHEFNYALVLGELKAIRKWACDQPARPAAPMWDFKESRLGWHYRNAIDAGWPIHEGLTIDLSGKNPQLVSPATLWRADEGAVLTVNASFTGEMKQAAIYWAAVAEPDFSAQRMAILPIRGDGERRDYTLRLTDNEAYRGMIQQLRIDPQAGGREGSKMVLHKVSIGPAASK